MAIVIESPPPELLEERRRKGIDHHDEMWEGVLHMPPMPTCDHQDFEWQLETFLRLHLKGRRIKVLHEVNVASPGGWPRDFRIPDLVLIAPSRAGIIRRECVEGGPDVVVEIESPGDETRKKIPFYARIGIGEAWIVDRDTREIEILLLRGGSYERQPPDAAGWTSSFFAGIEARIEGGKLLIRAAGDVATLERLPEE